MHESGKEKRRGKDDRLFSKPEIRASDGKGDLSDGLEKYPRFCWKPDFSYRAAFCGAVFSARILDALAQGADRRTVISWVIGAVASGYGIYLLERLFACLNSVEGVTLYWQLYQEMSRVC